jgi:hypothetical protein
MSERKEKKTRKKVFVKEGQSRCEKGKETERERVEKGKK